VETVATVWTLQGTDAPQVWSRQGTGPQRFWHAEDLGHITDTSLVSPVLHQLPGTTLTFSISHRHKFEGSGVFYDGAVLEFRPEGGTTWQDLSMLGTVPYGGALGAASGNPLAGRQALVATNPDWPAFTTVTLDLGTALQGQRFQVRLRMASDVATSAPGWDVDDLVFTGVEGTPFPSLVEDRRGLCPTAPVANAGADQSVPGGAAVLLDARASTDANGDVLSFHWTQTGGAAVVLNGGATALASFTSPTVTQATVLTFSVEVRDATQASSDETQVTVLPPAGECFIAAMAYQAGAPNLANPCEECAPGVSRTQWSPRVSGYPCAGDALDCTRDTCNGAGVCESTLASGCLIGSACVALGAENPVNACEACNPVLSTSEYSRKDTAACTAGSSSAGNSSSVASSSVGSSSVGNSSSGPITSSSRPGSSSVGVSSSAAGSSSAQAASQGDGGGDGSDGGGKCGCSSSGEETPIAPWMALAAVAFTVLRRRR
jgi:MYXO-CTERM domain-containing protein